MQSKLNPYLSFKDNTREAMEFYRTVFGGKLELSTFKELHASQDPSEDNMIMHSVLEADNGISFMASDTPSRIESVFREAIRWRNGRNATRKSYMGRLVWYVYR